MTGGHDWGVTIQLAGLLLNTLLIPVMSKIWHMDVRLAKVETKLEGD